MMRKAGRSEEDLARIYAELDYEGPPKGSEYITSIFSALSSRRQYGMGGPMPISFLEIDAYQRLLDVELSPFDVELLVDMDNRWLHERSVLANSSSE
jgi:hypothetical protein